MHLCCLFHLCVDEKERCNSPVVGDVPLTLTSHSIFTVSQGKTLAVSELMDTSNMGPCKKWENRTKITSFKSYKIDILKHTVYWALCVSFTLLFKSLGSIRFVTCFWKKSLLFIKAAFMWSKNRVKNVKYYYNLK